MSIRQLSQRALINVRDFFFPPLCLLCNNLLTGSKRWLCSSCLSELSRNNTQREPCSFCALNKNGVSCSCHDRWPHTFERIVSLFDFNASVQNLIHHGKYQGKKNLLYYLGSHFSPLIPKDLFQTIDCIVPVPLHFFRRTKRGYNQADYFARGVIQKRDTNLSYVPNLLQRIKHTKTQTRLTKEERRKNLANAFRVNPQMKPFVSQKRVLLVDDVVTTGSTADLCSQVLLKAQAKSVQVLSLARA